MRELPAVRRLVVKVGSSSLAGPSGKLDDTQVRALADQVAGVRTAGASCVVVTSGAIAAGLEPLGFARRPSDMASLQAAASVGQGILMHAYQRAFAKRKIQVGQVLLTQEDFVRRKSYVNAHAALERLLTLGVVPIVNENDTVATEEIRFGDNDRIAALVAIMVHADLLVILSDVDGLYDDDPRTHKARLLSTVEDLSHVRPGKASSTLGSGGITSKLEAIRVATSAGTSVIVANGRAPHVVTRALAGQEIGSLIGPARRRGSHRKLWIEFALSPRGRIVVDAGARAALQRGGTSLLGVGVTGKTGDFEIGDVVEIADADGAVFARGLTNYGSAEIPGALGAREVIHADSLVLLT